MSYSMFLGCTLPARGRNYEMSARLVGEKLGIEFADITDFTCCGYPLKSTDRELSLMMSAANLALAEKAGHSICTLCSACTAMLAETDFMIHDDPALKKRVNKHLATSGLRIKKPVQVKHFSRILFEEVGFDEISRHITRPLEGFSFAPHYGCHYLKPSEIHGNFDNVENPESLDKLIEITGANAIDLDGRKDCCGGAVLAVKPDITYDMAARKLDQLKAKKADGMVLICPFCAVVFDDNQRTIESAKNTSYNLPVLYYPQLLGLAMGFTDKALGLKLNKVKTKALLQRMVGD